MFIFKSSLLNSSIWLLLILFVGCGTEPKLSRNLNLKGEFQQEQLHNLNVNTLLAANNTVYAGTDNGLWMLSENSDGNEWVSLGLLQKKVFDFVSWNAGEFLVGTDVDSTNNISIYRTWDGGKTWKPYQNNFGAKDWNNHLYRIAKHPENENVLYARGDYNVVMSVDSGKTWNLLKGTWDGFGGGEFITINPSNPDIIWAGGVSALFLPELFKSNNGGKTWQQGSKKLREAGMHEAICYDLLIHPTNSDIVLSALSVGLYKSDNNGNKWKRTFNKAEFYTLTHSTQNPRIAFASGMNNNATLFFLASPNFGESWETIVMENSPFGIYVNDMISVMQSGHKVLYFATNKGIYSYTFEK